MALLRQCLVHAVTLIGETGVLTEVRIRFLSYLQTKFEITCNRVMLITSAVWLKTSAKSENFNSVIQTLHVMNCVHLLPVDTYVPRTPKNTQSRFSLRVSWNPLSHNISASNTHALRKCALEFANSSWRCNILRSLTAIHCMLWVGPSRQK
jgi:hypothetical protein